MYPIIRNQLSKFLLHFTTLSTHFCAFKAYVEKILLRGKMHISKTKSYQSWCDKTKALVQRRKLLTWGVLKALTRIREVRKRTIERTILRHMKGTPSTYL